MNKIVILDSNIIIYTGLKQHHQLRNWLKLKKLLVSAISQLEVLGYHKLVSKDKLYFESFFKHCELVPIHHEIINSAIGFRQQKKMSIGVLLSQRLLCTISCLWLVLILKISSTLKI